MALADPVARKKQLLFCRIPDRQREYAFELIDEREPALPVKRPDHGDIRLAGDDMPTLEQPGT